MKTDLINKSQIFSREELKEIRGGDYGYSGNGNGYCHAEVQTDFALTPFYTGQRCENANFCTQGHTGFEEWFQHGPVVRYTCDDRVKHY